MNITQRTTIAAAALAVAMLAPAPALAADAPTVEELTSSAANATVRVEKTSEALERVEARLAKARKELAEVESRLPSTTSEEVRVAATVLVAPFSPTAAERADKVATEIRLQEKLEDEIADLEADLAGLEADAAQALEEASTTSEALQEAQTESAAAEAERVRAEYAARVRLMIDPGHGGSDPGAVAGPITEKDTNLQISGKIASAAQRQGWNVAMTRDVDVFVPLAVRPNAAAQWGATAFVSVHSNSYGPNPQGNMTIYRSALGQVLGQEIMTEIAALTPYEDIGNRSDVRGLAVLRGATMPAVLVEVLSLSSQPELEALVNPEMQTLYAEAIVKGIADYHGVTYIPPTGTVPAAAATAPTETAAEPAAVTEAAAAEPQAASSEATRSSEPSEARPANSWLNDFIRRLVG